EDSEEPTSSKKVKLSKIAALKKENNVKISEPQWSEHELLAEQQNLTLNVAKNIVKLFEDGNTVPFIARYRRDVTNNMSPETLREVKETYEEIIVLKNKINTVVKNLEKTEVLTEQLKHNITSSRSIEELEYVYAPYKPGSKRTLAERAKELGLEEPALSLLHNQSEINLSDYVQKDRKELSSVADVEKGIVHIIASIISTDTEILSHLRQLRKRTNFIIKTKITKKPPLDEGKFENYENFEIPVKYIKPHQVLAINRGESLKVLSVKVVVPDNIFYDFQRVCFRKWSCENSAHQLRHNILKQAIEDSYNRLVQPLIIREIRAELKQQAEKASCEVFSTNLKHLLLTAPLKGKYILGIDPGFANGCKLALISPMGELILNNVIYPHKSQSREKDKMILKNMLQEHNCELIALGNGTACRQTEEWLTNLIQEKIFHPLDVKYTVVREDGASIYSCSAEAKKEFPKLDPNIISAASLARRIQDPLAELVKVEPKHLGVGMYQHDIKKKHLEEALNDVVSECVSFVGVDLNTTSQCLLRHVAGLSDKKAQQVIEYRNKNGPFICRKQLLEVHGIGQRIFQQCAGFLRVGPLRADDATAFYKNSKATKLDSTYIHPESYDIAISLIKKLNLKLCDVGETQFINVIRDKAPQLDLPRLNDEFKSNTQTIQLILDTLSKPLNHDLRSDCPQEPLFKKGLTSIDDITNGTVLTGRISNVTHFGCFVDIGVGINGLIHVSKYNGLNLEMGNKVEVKVINVEIERKRIGLEALKQL
ncbi:S1 RNA-binding domain-containing protein 1, partial [Asbolus verrucosus]